MADAAEQTNETSLEPIPSPAAPTVEAAAAAAESIVAHTLIPLQQQQQQEEVPPTEAATDAAAAGAAGHYDAPVIHAVAVADAEIPVMHDPHNNDVASAAQAAQAIAASASAYNIHTAGIIATADATFAGSLAGYNAVPAAAAANLNDAAASIEYMALAASPTAATPGTSKTSDTNRCTGIAFPKQAQGKAKVDETLHRQQTQSKLPPQTPQMQYREDAKQMKVPETAYLQQCTNGRQAMNILLREQKKALIDLNLAEKEFARAQKRLTKAKQHKASVDERIKVDAIFLTDELIEQKTRWNGMYKRLVEYKTEHGHCHVMRNPKRNRSAARKKNQGWKNSSEKVANLQSLGTWVGQVRLDARRPVGHPDRLEPYKIVALDRLGFDWEPRENYWMDMYEQLKTYLEKSGGRMPPRFINNKKFALGQWCDTQLDNYRKLNGRKKGGYITQEKINMLNQIGFVWDKRGHMWRENYDRLKEFKEKYGHCNATASNNGGDKSFGTWVAKQKRKYATWKRGETKSQELSLTDEQAALMNAIGFEKSVEVDGRKLRSLHESSRPKKMTKLSTPPNGTIAGLVNASEEIEGKPDGQNEQQQAQPQIIDDVNAEQVVGDNFNTNQQQGRSQSTGDVNAELVVDGNYNIEQAQTQRTPGVNDDQVMDENYNTSMGSTAVANSWGDSANAVSLLVDAIMNKDSHATSSDLTDGKSGVNGNEWTITRSY